jgi:WD40 repeat protein/formylglycine-generating enzyme required for sulfatase activity
VSDSGGSDNPYIGPRPFSEEENHLFFGREREAHELAALVVAHQLVLFYAQSGAGKTSLINARLVPALKAKGYDVLSARVGRESPAGPEYADIGNLYTYNVLLSCTGQPEEDTEVAQRTLVEYLAGREHPKDEADHELPCVLILDQFEELFTTHPERWDEREPFLRELRQALEGDPLLRVVMVLREEYMGQLDRYMRVFSDEMWVPFGMERLGPQAALEAICGPLAGAQRTFADGVAEALVNDLLLVRLPGDTTRQLPPPEARGEFVEPVQLQVVCHRLWSSLPAEVRVISREDLQTYGEIDRALSAFYEHAVAAASRQTSIDQQRVRDWCGAVLVTPLKTRGRVPGGRRETGGIPNSVVDVLVDEHLIRAEPWSGALWYELTHDRLIEPILASNEQADRGRWRVTQRRLQTYVRALVVVVVVLCVALTALMWRERQAAIRDRNEANDARATAVSEEHYRATAEADALRQRDAAVEARTDAENAEAEADDVRRVAVASLYAAQAIDALDNDPELGLLLAVEAVSTTFAVDGTYVAATDAPLRVGLADRFRHTLRGHKGTVSDVAFSSDAKTVLTASWDGTVRLWDREGTLLRILRNHGDKVNHASFSPDGLTVVSASADGTAALYNTETNSAILMSGHSAGVNHASFSPDGRRLVTASADTTAKLWDLRGTVVATLTVHQGPVNWAEFSPDGRWIATASDDGTARLWTSGGQLAANLVAHNDRVLRAVFSPDSSLVATCSADGTARLWNLTGELVATLAGHSDLVSAVAFSPDGRRIITASWDKTARVWLVSGEPQQVLTGHTGALFDAEFSPGGEFVVTAGADGTARLWHADGRIIGILAGHGAEVRRCTFSPDGRALATGSSDGTARLWATYGQTLTGHKGAVRSATFSPDGKNIVTAGEDATARLWSADGEPLAILGGHAGAVRCAQYSPDGQRIVTAGEDDTARIWDRQGNLLSTLAGHDDVVSHVALSPDGERVVTASWDNTAKLWDSHGQLLATLTGHTAGLLYAEFSPVGDTILTTSWDHTARLWSLDGECIATLEGHEDVVTQAAFSPDGHLIVTAGDDGTARLWDSFGHPLTILTGHSAGVLHAEFSPDGMRIVTSSRDHTARLWDTDGQSLAILSGHTSAVSCATYSSDGQRLLTASWDGSARLWDADGEFVATLVGHPGGVLHAAFSPDGRRIVTSSWDGTAQLHFVYVEDMAAAAQERVSRELSEDERRAFAGDALPTPTPTPPIVSAVPPGMILVPAGEFLMGSTDEDIDTLFELCSTKIHDCKRESLEDQYPQRVVYIDTFYIDTFEVTNAEYAQCVHGGACAEPENKTSRSVPSYYGNPEYDQYPVIRVSWLDALTYCEWAGKRLPAEAEWEKAARTTDARLYPWGNEVPGPSRLNYCDTNCWWQPFSDVGEDDGYKDTSPVGAFPMGASPYGAHDMSGNVWEWVADWYDADYYASGPLSNPKGPSGGSERVIRGGSYENTWHVTSATYRSRSAPHVRAEQLGFRCAASPTELAPEE